jgi:hypothetical protein
VRASIGGSRIVVVGTTIVEGASGARVASSAHVAAAVEIRVDARIYLVAEAGVALALVLLS